MNVYEVRHDSDHYEWLAPNGMDGNTWLDFTRLAALGQSVAARWSPLEFGPPIPSDEDFPGVLPTGDFIALGVSELALGSSAMSAVGMLMSRYGELLPVQPIGRAAALYWFHCTTLIDAMDEERSVMTRFSDGKVMSVQRLWVHPEKLRDAMLFHIPQNGSFLLCTDTFKQHIEALGLTGLRFTLKWSDEPSGMKKISDWEKRALLDMPVFPVPLS